MEDKDFKLIFIVLSALFLLGFLATATGIALSPEVGLSAFFFLPGAILFRILFTTTLEFAGYFHYQMKKEPERFYSNMFFSSVVIIGIGAGVGFFTTLTTIPIAIAITMTGHAAVAAYILALLDCGIAFFFASLIYKNIYLKSARGRKMPIEKMALMTGALPLVLLLASTAIFTPLLNLELTALYIFCAAVMSLTTYFTLKHYRGNPKVPKKTSR